MEVGVNTVVWVMASDTIRQLAATLIAHCAGSGENATLTWHAVVRLLSGGPKACRGQQHNTQSAAGTITGIRKEQGKSCRACINIGKCV